MRVHNSRWCKISSLHPIVPLRSCQQLYFCLFVSPAHCDSSCIALRRTVSMLAALMHLLCSIPIARVPRLQQQHPKEMSAKARCVSAGLSLPGRLLRSAGNHSDHDALRSRCIAQKMQRPEVPTISKHALQAHL